MKYKYVRLRSDDGVFDIPDDAIGVNSYEVDWVNEDETKEKYYIATYLIQVEKV